MKKCCFYKSARRLLAWIFVLSMIFGRCLETEVKVNASGTEGDTEIEQTSIITGTLGNNNGFTWTYEEGTKTLTVTGSDTGLYGDSINGSPFAALGVEIEKLLFENCTFSGSLVYLCSELSTLKEALFTGCDTSGVTSMNHMFYNCSSLRSVDVSGFDTGNVTSMNHMFYNCSSLRSVDVSGFDTGNVISMNTMFYGCSNLESVDVSGFDTRNAKYMFHMFSGCSSLRSVDISGFDTENVTNMGAMFSNCSSLGSIDVSGFDTGNVTNMGAMFSNCSNLRSVDVSSFDMSSVTSVLNMFSDCSNLESISAPKNMASGLAIDLPAMYYDSKLSSVTQITPSECGKSFAKTLYSITYELDGGVNDSSNLSSYTAVSDTIVFNAPTKEGYVFVNWYGDSGYQAVVTQIETGSTGDRLFYAKWIRLIKSGVSQLQTGEQYKLSEGNWEVEGDSTVYRGGNLFYISLSGDYKFNYIDGD